MEFSHRPFLIVLTLGPRKTADQIAARAGALIGRRRCRVCRTVKMLRDLRQDAGMPHVAVLLAADSGQLDQMVGLAPLFDGMKVLLMLPDDQPCSIAKGHLLRPRYIFQPHSDGSALLSIIGHIFTNAFKTASGNYAFYSSFQ